MFDNGGDIQEWVKYSSYGIPFLLTPGDFNKDGTVDKDDDDLFTADYGAYDSLADVLRRIALDEREHKLESLQELEVLPERTRRGRLLAAAGILAAALAFIALV